MTNKNMHIQIQTRRETLVKQMTVQCSTYTKI